MDLFRFLNRYKIILHLILWLILLFIVFYTESWEYGVKVDYQMLVQFFFAFVVFAAVCYFNTLFLIERYVKSGRYGLYALLLFLVVLFGAELTTLMRDFLTYLGYSPTRSWKHYDNRLHYFFHMLSGEITLVLLTTFFYVLEEWIRLQNITIKLKESESEKTRSELQALKAQINPHFLFNTLNNIYSHSLTQSPKAPEMILKLSSLMSYILYECSSEKVPMSNELEFIKDYIELEKNRFEDNLKVDLEITNQAPEKLVAPLLMIPLIENAFKHVAADKSGKSFVSVSIKVDTNELSLLVVNSTDQLESDKANNRIGGIGIENVRKRLDLIYPRCWDLKISKSDYLFEVDLKICKDGN